MRRVLMVAFLLVLEAQAHGQEPEPAAQLEAEVTRLLRQRGPARARRHIRRALRGLDARDSIRAFERLLSDARCGPDDVRLIEGSLEPRLRRQDGAYAFALSRVCDDDLEGALDHLSSFARPQHTGSANLLRTLAVRAVRDGDLRFAERALSLARRILPQDPDLLHELSALHVARGEPERAIALLQGRLRLRPDAVLTRRMLASALHAGGRSAEAIAAFMELGEEADLRQAARAALEAGWPGRAAALARRALGVSEMQAEGESQLVLGLALAGAGQPVGARRALRRARELLGDRPAITGALRALGEGPSTAP
ncbi:MAG: hypothetical protein AAF938_22225 [Myxococcota bacterium]